MPLKSRIRTIPDFPKPGIQFRDITTLLKDRFGFRKLVDDLVQPFAGKRVDAVAGIEALAALPAGRCARGAARRARRRPRRARRCGHRYVEPECECSLQFRCSRDRRREGRSTVSYTHLTLPTNREV